MRIALRVPRVLVTVSLVVPILSVPGQSSIRAQPAASQNTARRSSAPRAEGFVNIHVDLTKKVGTYNKFLIAIGVIKPGQKKTITPLGSELSKALDHEMPEEIAAKWRAVVNATDFLQNSMN
jgi:hypothetical protein